MRALIGLLLSIPLRVAAAEIDDGVPRGLPVGVDPFGRVLPFIGDVLASPWLAPRFMLDDDDFRAAGFVLWPYHDGYAGYPVPALIAERETFARGDWAWSVSADCGGGADHRRAGVQAVIEHSSRGELIVDVDRITRRAGGVITLGDASLGLRIAHGTHGVVRIGLGARLHGTPAGDRWGGGLLYGIDAYPLRPWVIAAQFDGGVVASQNEFRVRGSVGAALGPVEIFGGYSVIGLGAERLDGPLAGLRGWW